MLRHLPNGGWVFECDRNEREFINEVMHAADEHGMEILQFEYTECEFILLKFCKKGDNNREWCVKRGLARTDCHIKGDD